jgi:magnesium chelatase family protein
MLARRRTTILPAMRLAEALETTHLHSMAGLTGARTPSSPRVRVAPPHYTISAVGLIGSRLVKTVTGHS